MRRELELVDSRGRSFTILYRGRLEHVRLIFRVVLCETDSRLVFELELREGGGVACRPTHSTTLVCLAVDGPISNEGCQPGAARSSSWRLVPRGDGSGGVRCWIACSAG